MKRLAAIALAALTASPPAAAQEIGPGGRWTGSYVCAQGLTGLELIVETRPGVPTVAYFHFFEHPANPGVPEGCYRMEGRFDPGTRAFDLYGEAWITAPPDYVMVDLHGRLDQAGARYKGAVDLQGWPSSCTAFEVARAPPAPFPQACLDLMSLDSRTPDR